MRGVRQHLTIVAVLAATLLAGCGFHPRGKLPMPFETLYVSGGDYASFSAAVKRHLQSLGQVKIEERQQQAQAVLEILGENTDTQVLSLTSTGVVAEYSLNYRVAFRLRDNANRVWIPASEIVLRRNLTYDVNEVLGKEHEQALLYKDMQEDAVEQLTRRLSHARPPVQT